MESSSKNVSAKSLRIDIKIIAVEIIEEQKLVRISYKESIYNGSELLKSETKSYKRDYDQFTKNKFISDMNKSFLSDIKCDDPQTADGKFCDAGKLIDKSDKSDKTETSK